MNVAVWDTYVTKKDGTIMHFDIIVPEEIKSKETVYGYGKTYLTSKGQKEQALTTNECTFCHIETVRSDWEKCINQQGYFIYEIENCN
ncbi:DUF2024 family protein [Ancylomarina salipaludis]|uniref:DUF2024 family protein n=1 Tax=Ancylomarina salipaludis TaxID=2501299 RepID=A0A4Q1JNT8_9BACT|nr:DUF2024 family protein [Ancylomarina salipaludis]RXQ96570.1 DUF2024 family protein [Ancylomarina salipaludis]